MNTTRKNQHYVPKFYLRSFSYESDQKRVGIFNINTELFYPTAPLKNQASKTFFYGHDGQIEESLSGIEGRFATLVKQIVSSRDLPKKDSQEHKDLMSFVGLTHLRNPVAIQNIRATSDSLYKRVIELHPESEESIDIPKIGHQEAILYALCSIELVVNNMMDLDYKLLINTTSIPFITSDFPIVFYNQFLEDKKWNHGNTGYGSLGLQIYFPLHPRIAIFLYDPIIYKIGFNKRNSLFLNAQNDIDQLNITQIINCYDTIFFNEEIKENYMQKVFIKSKSFKKANQPISSIHNLISRDSKNSKMISLGSTDCATKLRITGIKYSSKAAGIKLSPTLAQLRPRPLELRNNYH